MKLPFHMLMTLPQKGLEMTKFNAGYLGQHRSGSNKELIHKEFDEKGLAAALMLGEKIRRQTGGETPKESTIRSWASFWKNHPGFRSSAQYRAARDNCNQGPVGATVTNEFSYEFTEEARSFRKEHVRRTPRPSRKVSIPVEIDEGLLVEAKAMDMNLSHFLEEELHERVKKQRGRRWAEENKEFID